MSTTTTPAAAIPAWLVWYLTQLSTNPLRTKAITGGILSGCQEATAQKLSGVSPSRKRIFQMAAYGFLVSGPLNHLLYEIMNKLFAGKPAKQAKIGQLLFSNLVISPTMNTVYISVMTILAGARSFSQVKAAVKGGLLSMQKVSWVVSPAALLFAQNYLPQYTWVPFFNLLAFAFGTYLNTMIKRKQRLRAEKANDKSC